MCFEIKNECLKITLSDLYKIVCFLPENEKEQWRENLYASMKKELDEERFPIEDIFTALYAELYYPLVSKENNIVAYGAGNMAKEYIPQIKSNVNIEECWDNYTRDEYVEGVKILRPKVSEKYFQTPIVVFVDDMRERCEIIGGLASAGYKYIYYFRDYIMLMHILKISKEILNYMTRNTHIILNDFINKFTYIDNVYPPVCISVLPNSLKKELMQTREIKERGVAIKEKLYNELLCLDNEKNFSKSLTDVMKIRSDSIFCLIYDLECFMRRLLQNHVKTRKRPIRMAEDYPYDPFVVFTIIRVVLEEITSYKEALDCVRKIYNFSNDLSLVILSLTCYFLSKCEKLTEAIILARHGIVVFPNSLLMNEVFYEISLQCKQEGMEIKEPLPEYDLSEYFCWSGLNFAWCGGMEQKSGKAMWGPCFRPLQCAALPEGEFWTGDEWTEFRKSIIDGSFRYCQKNQCPNIVAGWLPKKSDFKEGLLGKILRGDFSTVPALKELHLSYDNHCNLACPSCRAKVKTNTNKENCVMDDMFEKDIRPHLKKAEHLCLSGCGEAILSPHSKRLLKSLSLNDYPLLKVELRTNGTVLTPKAWESLGEGRKLIRHIAISIDAASKKLFEKLRFPAKWEVVINNLSFISKLRTSNQIDMLEFHVVVQSENLGELVDIVRLASKSCADAVTFSKIINWRSMPSEEYLEKNPFFVNSPGHIRLRSAIKDLIDVREKIEEEGNKDGHKMFINIHFIPDPNERYGVIRTGELKIR